MIASCRTYELERRRHTRLVGGVGSVWVRSRPNAYLTPLVEHHKGLVVGGVKRVARGLLA
jgi:hypothetical protein